MSRKGRTVPELNFPAGGIPETHLLADTYRKHSWPVSITFCFFSRWLLCHETDQVVQQALLLFPILSTFAFPWLFAAQLS